MKPPATPGDLDNTGAPATQEQHWPHLPAATFRYITTNLGYTIEMDIAPSETEDGEQLSLVATPEFQSFLGWEFMDAAHEILKPKVQIQRISTNGVVDIGKTNFMGTISPPGNGEIGEAGEAAARTWLLFVTPTVEVIQPPKTKPRR